VSRTNCFYRPPTIEKRDTAKIRIRCGFKIVYDKPLCILDGVIVEEFDLKNIDPNDIENITVLKGSEAATLFGCGREPGVIIIRTKVKGTINIKDAVSGEVISGASVDLFYGEHGQHRIRVLSDSFGRVAVNKIPTGMKYDLQVSNIGYKTYSASIKAETVKAGYSVSLQRNYSELKEVVVTSGQLIRCRKIIYSVAKTFCDCLDEIRIVRSTSIYSVNSKDVERDLKIYPNPVSRSQQVSIEFENAKTEKISLRLFSLDGKLVEMREYEAVEGANRISYSVNPEMTAGAYVIQLINGNGKIIKTDKLIIQ
jgi:hypothetical protein